MCFQLPLQGSACFPRGAWPTGTHCPPRTFWSPRRHCLLNEVVRSREKCGVQGDPRRLGGSERGVSVARRLGGSEARRLGGSERKCRWERGQGQGESWGTPTRSTILRPRPCTRHPVRSLPKPWLERDVFRPASRDVGGGRRCGPSRLPPMRQDGITFYQITSVRLQIICVKLYPISYYITYYVILCVGRAGSRPACVMRGAA